MINLTIACFSFCSVNYDSRRNSLYVFYCMLFQVHSLTTWTRVAVEEFNKTYSVEVAACTQAGRGMVSPRVELFVPEDSKWLVLFISSS